MKKVIPFEPVGLPVWDISVMKNKHDGDTCQKESAREIEKFSHVMTGNIVWRGYQPAILYPVGLIRFFNDDARIADQVRAFYIVEALTPAKLNLGIRRVVDARAAGEGMVDVPISRGLSGRKCGAYCEQCCDDCK